MKQFTKSLGQVFLNDQNIIKKIINFASPSPKIRIIEIGCGKGILSSELSKISSDLHIIEIDNRWATYVQNLQLPNTTMHCQDALKFNFNQFNSKSSIIANIPYQITTPLIEHFVQHKHKLSKCTIMIQKEVADRILANSNSKTYGLLTIFCNYHFEIEKGFNVSRNCFFPSPKVDSHVLSFTPKKRMLTIKDEPKFFAMTKSLFWGRRKTILKCLMSSPYLICDKSIKEQLNIQEELIKRGETLSMKQLISLFTKIKQKISIKETI